MDLVIINLTPKQPSNDHRLKFWVFQLTLVQATAIWITYQVDWVACLGHLQRHMIRRMYNCHDIYWLQETYTKFGLTIFSPSVSASSDTLIDLNAFIRDPQVNLGLPRFFHATNTAAKQWLSPSEFFILVSWMKVLLNPSSRANSCHLFLSQSSNTTVLARSAKSGSSSSLKSSPLSTWIQI